MAVLLSEAQTEIPAKSVNHTNLTYSTIVSGGVILKVQLRWEAPDWEEKGRIHVMPVHPVQLLAIASCCQSLSLMPSQRDLSLGALPALCCAPLVEEVLVYCLHDLVKYVYMNDDQLV